MLEGLDAIMQRIDTIQKKVQQFSEYGRNFSEALAKKTEKSDQEHTGMASMAGVDGTGRNTEAMVQQLNAFNRGLGALGGMSGDMGGGDDFGLGGLASQQALLNAQQALSAARAQDASRVQEAQRLQDVASQAARLRPATYGNSAFDQQIRQASAQFGLPFALIKAVVHQESAFNPYAVSRAGAQGLMQIMPRTGQALGLRNPFDAGENIMAGSAYLKEMMNRYSDNLPLALAAYNAGPGAVDAAGGVPNYAETKDYVQRVMSYYGSYSQGGRQR